MLLLHKLDTSIKTKICIFSNISNIWIYFTFLVDKLNHLLIFFNAILGENEFKTFMMTIS